RPPADQIGGNADGYIPRWDRYDPPARQQSIQRSRGHAEQDAERTLSLLQLSVSWGMVDSVCARTFSAWYTSSPVAVPPWKRACAICRAFFCLTTLSCAISTCACRVRMPM